MLYKLLFRWFSLIFVVSCSLDIRSIYLEKQDCVKVILVHLLDTPYSPVYVDNLFPKANIHFVYIWFEDFWLVSHLSNYINMK